MTAPTEWNEATIVEIQAAMNKGGLTSVALVHYYLQRIEALDRRGPAVNAIVEVNPDALEIAESLDAERRICGPRGPLHGIPVVLKDNMDTGDRMQTTAGSLALLGAPAARDAEVVAKLRAAGAVILAKANMCEWADSRSPHRHAGWSGRGGQTRSPYALDRSPAGSSGGSAVAVSANLTTVALGTETDGSVVTPAGVNGVVGIKPTLGLTSCAGIVPVSHNLDVVGVFGRTVADAATVLSVIVSTTSDHRLPAPFNSPVKGRGDYEKFVNPDGLKGARIGVVRDKITGIYENSDMVYREAVRAMTGAGAVVVDPADIPTLFEIFTRVSQSDVVCYDFKHDLNAYLQTRTGVPVRNLADVIAFNLAHARQELSLFGQQILEKAQSAPVDRAKYEQGIARMRRIGGPLGLDAVLKRHRLDAVVVPSGPPAMTMDPVNGDPLFPVGSTPAAIAGYPAISVPMGSTFGLPVGITFIGTAFQERTLIKLVSGFEHAIAKARLPPAFLEKLAFDASGSWLGNICGL